jgi:hypothetical protein
LTAALTREAHALSLAFLQGNHEAITEALARIRAVVAP